MDRAGDLHSIQRALGILQITTTKVYARVGDEQLRRVVGQVCIPS